MNLESSDDTHLIALIAKAHPDALEVLYVRYRRLIYSVTLAVLGDRSTSEEATLDVFLRVWRGANTYDPSRAKVRTWLLVIARHHAIDILRRRGRRLDTTSLSLDDMTLIDDTDAPDPEESAEMAMQREEIREAFKQLPGEQRQVLILAYFKGYTQGQIAELLAQPLGTVKTRGRLAMKKLRKLLSKEGQREGKSAADKSAYPIGRKK